MALNKRADATFLEMQDLTSFGSHHRRRRRYAREISTCQAVITLAHRSAKIAAMSFKPVNSVLLSALVASVLSLMAARAGASAPQSRSTEAVRQYLETEMASRHIPGMQVAVVRRGRIEFLAAMGVADIDGNVPVTDSTMFAIASATKAFTGVALMQLVERHKLDLAAPVSRYLDHLPPAWGESDDSPVGVRGVWHCRASLTMTQGN